MLSKIDLLEKLAQLRRANLLTDEEYEAQKKQILAEASGLHEPAGSTAAQAGEQAAAAPAQPEDASSHADWSGDFHSTGNPKTPLLIGAALGLVALLAFFTVPGSPGTRALAVMQWQSMSTPELEHEFQRAFATGLGSFLTCANEGEDAAAACATIGPIVDDTIQMGEILCSRDAASETCEETRKLKEMKQLMGSLSDMSDQMQRQLNDLTSYEPK
ncbi:MAG TPA: SHOCT domain-containing protein [Sphingomicrobium sp.]